MLYRFKSRETADVIMLAPNARQLLAIIGKPHEEPEAKRGILLVGEMPAAMAALEVAVQAEERARQEAMESGVAPATPPGWVSLRQRSQPLMEMMRRCIKAEREIVWGV